MLKNFKSEIIIFGTNKTITAEEFELKVNQLANYLISIGLQKNDYALIHADNSIEYLLLILAFWKISSVPVLVNKRLTVNELLQIIQNIKPKFVFTDSEISTLPNFIKLSELQYLNEGTIQNDSMANDSQIIIFTSGSSGKPKGVVHTLENIFNSVMNIKSVEDYAKEDNFLLSLPLFHIGGLMIFFRSYFSSAKLTIPLSTKVEELIKEIKLKKITILSLVPTQLKRIIDQKILSPKSLRSVYIGGSAADKELIEKAVSLGWKIKKVYGSTETCSMVVFNDVNKNTNKIDSVGQPIPNNHIYILSNDGNLCKVNERGQIGVRGNTILKKYFNNNAETSKVFLGEIFLTGDYGYTDKQGFLYLSGRIKNIIISGGENIDPLEVENAIMEINGCQDVFVFGKKDTEWGEIVCAAIETKDELSENDIRKMLKNKIASYKVPKSVRIFKCFPRNEMGKINVKKIIELFDS